MSIRIDFNHKMNIHDKQAFDHYVQEGLDNWIKNALKWMVNVAEGEIFKDYLEIYKSKQSGTISTDPIELLAGILALPEFKVYKKKASENERPNRKVTPSLNCLTQDIFLDQYELDLLNAYYDDYIEVLKSYVDNKFSKRRKKFVEHHFDKIIKSKNKERVPKDEDDFINFCCSKADYKKAHGHQG